MTNLKQAFAKEIEAMVKAAEANVDEATKNVAARSQAVDDCNKRYNDLQAATNAAQSKLKSASSDLRGVAKDRGQKTGTAIQVRAAIDRYTEYAEQLPGARNEVADANDALYNAEAELNQAKVELSAIRFFA